MARLLEHIPVEEEPKIASQAADAPAIPGVEVEKITLVRTIGGMFQRHDDGEAPLLIQVHDPDQSECFPGFTGPGHRLGEGAGPPQAAPSPLPGGRSIRSEEHTSELQSLRHLV